MTIIEHAQSVIYQCVQFASAMGEVDNLIALTAAECRRREIKLCILPAECDLNLGISTSRTLCHLRMSSSPLNTCSTTSTFADQLKLGSEHSVHVTTLGNWFTHMFLSYQVLV